MKKVSLGALLFLFTVTFVSQPMTVRADDGRDEDEDEMEAELEVEAEVYTDTTVVEVELPDGTKHTFTTEADTEAEVIDVVADKFDLSSEEVAAVLEFEIEDRKSPSSDTMPGKDKEKKYVKHELKDRMKVCRNDRSLELEVEADIFTDVTIVKVALASGTKKVFETRATTTAAIALEVADRYDLDLDEVEMALEVEVEDRASKIADRAIAYNPAGCDDARARLGDKMSTTTLRDADLRAQVAELQKLLDTLLRLFSERFGGL